ncbi:Multifunctional non-homologous end joining protein LigD [subsurface metagenome]
MPIFVIHKHHATHLHWDLRLEMDNVLKSWAVPKEPPVKPGIKRLALQVEDHALDYADFEGDIPDDQYGAGKVEIWDTGEYNLLERHENRMKFELLGDKLKGIYALFKFPKAGKNAWLFFKIGKPQK